MIQIIKKREYSLQALTARIASVASAYASIYESNYILSDCLIDMNALRRKFEEYENESFKEVKQQGFSFYVCIRKSGCESGSYENVSIRCAGLGKPIHTFHITGSICGYVCLEMEEYIGEHNVNTL